MNPGPGYCPPAIGERFPQTWQTGSGTGAHTFVVPFPPRRPAPQGSRFCPGACRMSPTFWGLLAVCTQGEGGSRAGVQAVNFARSAHPKGGGQRRWVARNVARRHFGGLFAPMVARNVARRPRVTCTPDCLAIAGFLGFVLQVVRWVARFCVLPGKLFDETPPLGGSSSRNQTKHTPLTLPPLLDQVPPAPARCQVDAPTQHSAPRTRG